MSPYRLMHHAHYHLWILTDDSQSVYQCEITPSAPSGRASDQPVHLTAPRRSEIEALADAHAWLYTQPC